jgi:hypothetical protein
MTIGLGQEGAVGRRIMVKIPSSVWQIESEASSLEMSIALATVNEKHGRRTNRKTNSGDDLPSYRRLRSTGGIAFKG